MQLVIGHGLLTCKKMKGQLVHSRTRINSFILPRSSKLQFTTAAFRFWASFVVKARMGLKSAIDNRSTSSCQSTLMASKCDQLDRVILLAFSGSWGVIFMLAMIGNSWLYMSASTLPFPFFCMGNGCFTSISTGRNGMKTSPFLLLPQGRNKLTSNAIINIDYPWISSTCIEWRRSITKD